MFDAEREVMAGSPEWRNWQTRRAQTPFFVGSTPTSGTSVRGIVPAFND